MAVRAAPELRGWAANAAPATLSRGAVPAAAGRASPGKKPVGGQAGGVSCSVLRALVAAGACGWGGADRVPGRVRVSRRFRLGLRAVRPVLRASSAGPPELCLCSAFVGGALGDRSPSEPPHLLLWVLSHRVAM